MAREQRRNIQPAVTQEVTQRPVIPPNFMHRGYCGDISKLTQAADEEMSLYVMRSVGVFKVGVSRDLEKRLKSIRAQCAHPVDLVAEWGVRIDLAGWTEYVAHVALSPWHYHDEWFVCDRYVAVDTCRMAVQRSYDIPWDWWREERKQLRDFIPKNVHKSARLRVADLHLYPLPA